MTKINEKEILVTSRPMNDKQLMNLYEIRHRQTWKKLLNPISWKLVGRKRDRRYIYSKEEVEWIFDFLGQPVVFVKIKDDTK